MNWSAEINLILVFPAVFICSACSAENGIQSTSNSIDYIKPREWQSECIGRWLIDVPSPIDFGAAAVPGDPPPWFDAYGIKDLRKSNLASGEFSISSFYVIETNSFRGNESIGDTISAFQRSFDSDKKRASYYPEIKDLYETIPLISTANGFAGHRHDSYEIIFFDTMDNRARIFSRNTTSDASGKIVNFEESARMARRQAHLVVESFLPRYSARKPGHIPSVPGVCSPYGFFTDTSSATERDYMLNMAFRDPRYSNLILRIDIRTRNRYTWSLDDDVDDIHQAETPWDIETRFARQDREDCRAQQGTASRDLLGCTFAGMTNISKQHEVRYLTLANGQEARLLVLEYKPAINEGLAYEVLVEALGTRDSPTEPRIVVSGRGYAAITPAEPLHGNHPPPLEEAIELVRTLALSLRLRPGAVDPARPVIDSMEGLR